MNPTNCIKTKAPIVTLHTRHSCFNMSGLKFLILAVLFTVGFGIKCQLCPMQPLTGQWGICRPDSLKPEEYLGRLVGCPRNKQSCYVGFVGELRFDSPILLTLFSNLDRSPRSQFSNSQLHLYYITMSESYNDF